jgi:hypothetical protein
MDDVKIDTLNGAVVIDKCGSCAALWFDHGEEIQLKDNWMSDFVDSGDSKIGKNSMLSVISTVRDVKIR